MMPSWYGDFKTGDHVHMRYIDPPLMGETASLGTSTTTCEGILDRFSMDPIDGYPWNNTPHAVSLAVIDECGFEHRAPINRIVRLNPLTNPANVNSDLEFPNP